MYAIPLNTLIKKTRLRSRACTSRRLCMISTPSRFVAENVNADTRKSFIWGLRLALRFCDAAARSVFIVVLQFAFASSGDLAIRRSIERVVFEVRTEIAHVCQQVADKCGEPPLSEQD
jgi:hypothetical protein